MHAHSSSQRLEDSTWEALTLWAQGAKVQNEDIFGRSAQHG